MWALFSALDPSSHLTISRHLQDWFSAHALNILVILIGAWLLRRFGTAVVSKVIDRTVRKDLFPTETDRKKRIDTLNSLIGASMGIIVSLIAAVMIVSELGVNTAPLLASAGVIGIALGFGAQSLIKDFVSGIFIIIENQYRVGDVVDLGDASGSVEAITIRTTVLRDLDGSLYHVPNGSISITINKTIGYSQVNEDIVVALDTNLEQLEHLINHVGQEIAAMPMFTNKIIDAPHMASISGFKDFGISVKVLAKTSPGDQWAVKNELYRRLHKAFNSHHIEIAQPPLQPVKKSKK